jgi:hypothetical protein
VGLDQGPLRVGDVAGVMLRSHSTFYASHPLWDRLSVRFGSDDCDTPFPSALVVWGAKPETIQALDRALPDAWRTR